MLFSTKQLHLLKINHHLRVKITFLNKYFFLDKNLQILIMLLNKNDKITKEIKTLNQLKHLIIH